MGTPTKWTKRQKKKWNQNICIVYEWIDEIEHKQNVLWFQLNKKQNGALIVFIFVFIDQCLCCWWTDENKNNTANEGVFSKLNKEIDCFEVFISFWIVHFVFVLLRKFAFLSFSFHNHYNERKQLNLRDRIVFVKWKKKVNVISYIIDNNEH